MAHQDDLLKVHQAIVLELKQSMDKTDGNALHADCCEWLAAQFPSSERLANWKEQLVALEVKCRQIAGLQDAPYQASVPQETGKPGQTGQLAQAFASREHCLWQMAPCERSSCTSWGAHKPAEVCGWLWQRDCQVPFGSSL